MYSCLYKSRHHTRYCQNHIILQCVQKKCFCLLNICIIMKLKGFSRIIIPIIVKMITREAFKSHVFFFSSIFILCNVKAYILNHVLVDLYSQVLLYFYVLNIFLQYINTSTFTIYWKFY